MNAVAKVHVFYCAAILIAVIIGLSSIHINDMPHAADYLAVASNLLSLVLAVLAIVYAFISNFSLSSTLSSITGLASKVTDAGREMTEASRKVVDSSFSLGSQASEIAAVSQALGESIKGMEAVTNSVVTSSQKLSESIAELGGSVKSIDTKVDQTQELIRQSGTTRQETVAAAEKSGLLAREDAVAPFLSSSSLGGHFAAFVMVLSKQHQKAFSAGWASQFGPASSTQYTYGFIIALITLGFAKHARDGSDSYKITGINPGLEKGIRDALIRNIKENFAGMQVRYLADVEKVEQAFKDPQADTKTVTKSK